MEIIRNQLLPGADNKPMLYDVHYKSDQRKKSVILYVHGFNGFKDWGNFDLIANYFAENGFFFVKMNLFHNGTTKENPSDFADLDAYSQNNYTKELSDVEKMIDWICDAVNPYAGEFDNHKIVLLGHSRGGGISIIKSSEDKRVSAIITWASVAACKTPWGNWDEAKMEAWKRDGVAYIENKRTKQQMPLRYQLFEDYLQNKDRLNIKNAVEKIDIPMQVCHGTQDEAVPFDALLQFQKWKPGAEFVTVESNHVFDRKHPYTESFIPLKCMEVIKQNIEFLRKNGF